MSYSSEVAADSPTRYWRLQDTSGTVAYDNTTLGDGTYTGTGVTLQAAGYSTGGSKAVTFDGSTGAMTASVSQASATLVTFECWFNWTTYATDGKGMVEWGNDATGGSIFVVPNEATGKFRVGWSSKPAVTYDTSEFTRPAAGWHHLAVVFDLTAGSGLRTVPYIDGSPISYTKANTDTAAGKTLESSAQTIKIGGLAAGTFSACSVSEVVLYVGNNLSAARIAAHYAARDRMLLSARRINPGNRAVQRSYR